MIDDFNPSQKYESCLDHHPKYTWKYRTYSWNHQIKYTVTCSWKHQAGKDCTNPPKERKTIYHYSIEQIYFYFFGGGINYYKILIIRIYKVKSTRLTIHQAAQITPRPLKPCPSGKPKAESRLAGAVLWMSCVVRGQCEGLSENRYIYGILVYQPQKG